MLALSEDTKASNNMSSMRCTNYIITVKVLKCNMYLYLQKQMSICPWGAIAQAQKSPGLRLPDRLCACIYNFGKAKFQRTVAISPLFFELTFDVECYNRAVVSL
jgi:hypothetical protein